MSVMKDLFIDDMDKALERIIAYSIIEDTINDWVNGSGLIPFDEFTELDILDDEYTNDDIYDNIVYALTEEIEENSDYGYDIYDAIKIDILTFIKTIMEKYVEA